MFKFLLLKLRMDDDGKEYEIELLYPVPRVFREKSDVQAEVHFVFVTLAIHARHFLFAIYYCASTCTHLHACLCLFGRDDTMQCFKLIAAP